MEKQKGGIVLPILLDLFLSFAKIGLFTFGGGYAMLSLIENMCVEKKKWITSDEMMNMTVIARFLDRFLEIKQVANAFKGIKIAVGILIIDAAIKLFVKMEKKLIQIGIVICSGIAMILINVLELTISSMLLMIMAALTGILICMIRELLGKGLLFCFASPETENNAQRQEIPERKRELDDLRAKQMEYDRKD